MTTPSNQAINALAFLMHEVRPDWDAPGCVAALRRVPEVGLVDLIVAAVKCAADPANDTPVALVHLNNRVWDSDWYLPCKTHPKVRARRTNGECAGCYADRMEDSRPISDRGGVPMPEQARADVLAALDASIRARKTETVEPEEAKADA